MKSHSIHTLTKGLLALTITLLAVSCNHHTPKPSGYFRIDMDKPAYQMFSNNSFQLLYSQKAQIEQADANKEWFNIFYPAFNASIHCSYMNISPKDYTLAVEDSRKFVYKHSVKADNIRSRLYENPQNNTSGILYEIDGAVASPIQFTLSDSTSFFFRGALYFNFSTNRDSITPILNSIKEDIGLLMETFQQK